MSKRKSKVFTISNEKLNREIDKQTIKNFFKYKIFEIIGIPIALLILWQLPLNIGWAIIKIFNINPETTPIFCISTSTYSTSICDGISYGSIWFIGLLISILLGAFIYMNWKIALENAEEKILDKYQNYRRIKEKEVSE